MNFKAWWLLADYPAVILSYFSLWICYEIQIQIQRSQWVIQVGWVGQSTRWLRKWWWWHCLPWLFHFVISTKWNIEMEIQNIPFSTLKLGRYRRFSGCGRVSGNSIPRRLTRNQLRRRPSEYWEYLEYNFLQISNSGWLKIRQNIERHAAAGPALNIFSLNNKHWANLLGDAIAW